MIYHVNKDKCIKVNVATLQQPELKKKLPCQSLTDAHNMQTCII